MNTLNFDQEGVNSMQAIVLGRSPELLQIELTEIRNDFDSWINKFFSFTTNQLVQLQSMDLIFKQELAYAIANSYAAGVMVVFSKDDKDDDEVPDKKSIVVHGLDKWQAPLETSSATMIVTPLMIRIHYG
ncbi:hypothetical protein [Sphingobacterium faecium]|jgi:hypothetical protein